MTNTDAFDKKILNSTKAFSTLQTFLEEDEWHPRSQEEDPFLLCSTFSGKHGRTSVYSRIIEDNEWFLVLVFTPFEVPADRRVAVTEFLSRANYGLNFGAFQMDHRDGELAFRRSINFAGMELRTETVRGALYSSVGVMDTYLPGLMAVVYGGMTAEEAIAKVENAEKADVSAEPSDDELPN